MQYSFFKGLNTGYFQVKENMFANASVLSFPVPYDLPPEKYGNKGKVLFYIIIFSAYKYN